MTRPPVPQHGPAIPQRGHPGYYTAAHPQTGFAVAPGPQAAPVRQLAQRPPAPTTAPLTETGRAPAIEAAQVSHNIGKSQRLGKPAAIEIRVARAAIAGAGGAGPQPASLRAELVAVRAITVRLRGGKAAFHIDAGSPETQWDQATGPSGRLAGETAVWRFTLTPLKPGRSDLHLVATARTIGADGVIADTVLPEEIVSVRVGRDIGKPLRRLALAIGIAAGSIAVEKLAEGIFKFDLFAIVSRLVGL